VSKRFFLKKEAKTFAPECVSDQACRNG